MVVVKCCSGCGVVKSLDDFPRNRKNSDGREYKCRGCKSAYNRRYYEENRDNALEYSRRYYEENRDNALESRRRYREENRDKVREAGRRYHEGNRDKELERMRRYYEENQEYHRRQRSKVRNQYQSVTESAATKRGPWSEAEIAILMADDGRTMVAKALELGRTHGSCRGKLDHLRRTGATN